MIDLDKEYNAANESSIIPDGEVQDPDIERMIGDLVAGGVSGAFEEFLESLLDWYERHGWLTAEQYRTLEHAWVRADTEGKFR